MKINEITAGILSGVVFLLFTSNVFAVLQPVICKMDLTYGIPLNGNLGGASKDVIFKSCSWNSDSNSSFKTRWVFHDGTVLEGENVTFTFYEAGSHQITLWLKDSNGEDVTSNLTILLVEQFPDPPSPTFDPAFPTNTMPIAKIAGPYVVLPNEVFTFNASASFDYDETVDGRAQFLQAGWDFGDGCSYNLFTKPDYPPIIYGLTPRIDYWMGNGPGNIIVYDGDGSAFAQSDLTNNKWVFNVSKGTSCISSGFTPSHSFEKPGTYTVDLMVVDKYFAEGYTTYVGGVPYFYAPGIGSAQTSVRVNQKPVAVVAAINPSSINQVVIFDASNSYDLDGDTLTYIWDFGDGNIATSTNNLLPHVFSSEGEYTVTLLINDGSHTSELVQIVVSISNMAWLVPIIYLILN